MKRLKKLYWCIDQIEARKILRGMSTNELKQVFGQALDYNHRGQPYSVLSLYPDEIDPAYADHQAGPMWEITFTINQRGFVTDYSLRKTSEK